MKSRISVIIPTFNRADLLPDAIASATRQVNVTTEVIVVDDGSTDATREIVKELDVEVKYFYQEHRGTAAARNFGLQQASGEYVIFLDSDDVLMPNKNLQVDQIRLNPDIAVVYSRWQTTTLNGVVLRKPGKDVTVDPLSHLLCHNISAIHACLFRASSLHQIGGFDETLTILEDWDLLIQLALEGFHYFFIPEVTATYRLHSGNKTELKDIALQDGLRITDKIIQHPRLPSKYNTPEIYASLQCLRYLETIRRCLAHFEHKIAYMYLEQLYESIPLARIWMKASSIEDIVGISSDTQVNSDDPEYNVGIEEIIRLKSILEGYIKSL